MKGEWVMAGELVGQALPALAAAGGAAVVQAAGTDVWTAFRGRVARLFGRGDAAREQAELDRLDSTREALEPEGTADPVRARIIQEGRWQGWFETLLENAEGAERDRLAAELRALVVLAASASGGDTAVGTGRATARAGGEATTGVRRAGGGQGHATAVNTGDAEADGPGSSATSGVVIT
jgi:hypothetical protein